MPIDPPPSLHRRRRWSTRVISGALSSAILLAGSTALAWPSARLVYSRAAGAESCADEGGVRSAVAARLGYDPFVRESMSTVVARVFREQALWRAQVALIDASGVERGARQLESTSPDCAVLITTMALTISIAIDPLSVARPAPPAPPSSSEEAQAPSAHVDPPALMLREPPAAPAPTPATPGPPLPVEAAPPAVPAAKAPDAIDLSVGLGLVGSLGVGAGPAFGGIATGALRFRMFSFAVEARADAPSSIASSEGGRVRSFAGLGSLVPCAHYRMFFGCAVGTIGAVQAGGVEVSAPRSGGTLHAGVGGRVGISLDLGRQLELLGFTSVLANLTRFAVTINAVEVFRSSPVAGDLGAALRLHF